MTTTINQTSIVKNSDNTVNIHLDLSETIGKTATTKGKQRVLANAIIKKAPENFLTDLHKHLFTFAQFKVQARKVLWESKESASDIEIEYTDFYNDCETWAMTQGTTEKGNPFAKMVAKTVKALLQEYQEDEIPLERQQAKITKFLFNTFKGYSYDVKSGVLTAPEKKTVEHSLALPSKEPAKEKHVFNLENEKADLLERFSEFAKKLPKSDRERVKGKIENLKTETEVNNLKVQIKVYEDSFKA